MRTRVWLEGFSKGLRLQVRLTSSWSLSVAVMPCLHHAASFQADVQGTRPRIARDLASVPSTTVRSIIFRGAHGAVIRCYNYVHRTLRTDTDMLVKGQVLKTCTGISDPRSERLNPMQSNTNVPSVPQATSYTLHP